MAKLYYRGMAEENGKPKVGRSARLLGIRPGIDIDVEQMPKGWLDDWGYLKPETERNSSEERVTVVIRNTKGMSASLSIEGLPMFRKSPTFGGTGKDPLWQIDDSKITGALEAIQDSATHVSILPITTMLLNKYEAALANTQNDWEKVG
ncbi:hypothetical protein NIES4075_34290 [Tolypothrix sp. NIES-4075]|uniref:Tse2 family ADP-ribosyltransferase toxin n=1 Tax=Tolypothrix sp. NIES-4075 TaxID=2005459 RepID=UPI000B5CCC48|nr:hypothetical protein [Tolypothrix sp. NIES-4075]GAX42428.1 hypothetical protein NIES4075_34290 [Tolypothrix sp. NIES-4075]